MSGEAPSTTAVRRFRVTWIEVSHHEVELTEDELASLRDESDYDDPQDTGGLDDGLAELDDDGFQWLTREDIEVTEITPQPARNHDHDNPNDPVANITSAMGHRTKPTTTIPPSRTRRTTLDPYGP